MRLWRQIRTGIAFAAFGGASLVLALAWIPVLRWRSESEEEWQIRTQRAIHTATGRFLAGAQAMGLLRVRIDGAERLEGKGLLVVANHPTLLDAVVLMSRMQQIDCVTNQERFGNPFMRGALRASGYVPNAGGPAVVELCADRLRRGRSLLLFPEGTRSCGGRLGDFRRGAAHIALASGRDLLPVVITCDPPTLAKGQKWYQVPERSFELTLRVGEALQIAEFRRLLESGSSRAQVARRLTAALREHFQKRLAGVRAR